jgi:hypothetical protein
MDLASQVSSQNDETLNHFRYQSFKTASSIRVLALDPGTGDAALQGQLQHVDLASSTPSFCALSYVWGTVVYDRSFECQSSVIMITQSLEEALKRLRLPDKVINIWADGICINQQDVRERESQVKLMGQIYTRAHQIMIWLGPDPQNKAQTAFNLLKEYSDVDQYDEDKVRDPATDWSPLAELARMGYFKTIWVLSLRYRLSTVS